MSSSVPNLKLDGAMVGEESDGADFHSLCGDIFFLKLSSFVSFDEGSFSDSSISNKNDFELGNNLRNLKYGEGNTFIWRE